MPPSPPLSASRNLTEPGPVEIFLLISFTSGASFVRLSGDCATSAMRFFEPMTVPMPPRPANRHLSSPDFSSFSVLSATAAKKQDSYASPAGPMAAKCASA